MAQYASPYLGMGNNPVSFIDPTGGKDFNFYGTSTDYGLGGSGKSNVPLYYLSPGAIDEMRKRTGVSYDAQEEAKIIELAAMGGYIDEAGNKIIINYDNGEAGYYEQAEYLGKGESGSRLWRNPANGKLYSTKDGTNALGVWTSLDLSSAQSNGGNSNWANNTANGLGAFGFANEGKNALIDYATKVGNIGDDATKYLKISKGLSRGAGVLGLGVTLADAAQKGQWQNHHTADLAVGIATTFMLSGPWGWAIGGVYFLTDIAVQGYTGRSITENLFDPTPTLNPNKR